VQQQPPKPSIAGLLRQAIAHHQAGQRAQAESVYRQVLALHPNHPDALNLLGVLAIEAGRLEAGISSIRRAISIAANIASYHSNLATALNLSGRPEEAAAAYRTALALSPNDADLHYRLGNVLQFAGQFEQSIESFRVALALRPDFAAAYNDMGNSLKRLGLLTQAAEAYRHCLAVAPDSAEALSNLSDALRELRQLPESLEAAQHAVHLRPDFADGWCNLANTLKDLGRMDEAIEACGKSVRLKPDSPAIATNYVYSLNFQSDDPAVIYAAHREFDRHFCAPLARKSPHRNDRSSERRLKIGYISADFRAHSVGRMLQPLFANHDHEHFQIVCYSDTRQSDHLTGWLRARSDAWIETAALSDAQLAARVEAEEIDILIDLTQHMAGNRLLTFARQPGPVQISYGYPATTGLSAIKYRFTDSFVDPPGETEQFNSEKLLRIDPSFWCHWPDESDPPVAPLPALKNAFVTFGCLNNPCKVSPAALDLFVAVLNAIPLSRLMLLTLEPVTPQNYFARELAVRGIDPSRVHLVNPLPRHGYLQLYDRIDIGLDPIPYNGHMTSCDSFWMGVPVLTLRGKTSVGRGGVSLLQNLNLPELIADTPDAYVAIASQLARDIPRLDQLRRTLRSRMQASPLCDAESFTQAIESAYRSAWRTWCIHETSTKAPDVHPGH